MPEEHDDYRERQLAALRRYVSDLDVRRQPDGLQIAAAEERRRPVWPWLLVTLLLMAVCLAGGIAIGTSRGGGGDGGSSGFEGTTATSVNSVAAPASSSPECAEAVERASKSMGHAIKVSAALREHTEIMNDLLHNRIDADTALRTGTPSLIIGSAESAKFDVALADYKKVVDSCKLRTP